MVEFKALPRLEAEFGDVGPDEKRSVDLREMARAQGVEGQAFDNAITGALIDADPSNRFLVLHEDEEGNQRASAAIYVKEGKVIRLTAVPVSVTYPDHRPKIRLTLTSQSRDQPPSHPFLTVTNEGSDEALNVRISFYEIHGTCVSTHVDNVAPRHTVTLYRKDLTSVRKHKSLALWEVQHPDLPIFLEPSNTNMLPLSVAVEYLDSNATPYVTRYQLTTINDHCHLEFKGDTAPLKPRSALDR